MKVYSLLGFNDYEGSDLVGVFGDLQSIMDCVESGNGKWYYDQMGYVESELGEQIEDVLEVVEYVEFERYSYKVVDKL
jgi:hypothetical protein